MTTASHCATASATASAVPASASTPQEFGEQSPKLTLDQGAAPFDVTRVHPQALVRFGIFWKGAGLNIGGSRCHQGT